MWSCCSLTCSSEVGSWQSFPVDDIDTPSLLFGIPQGSTIQKSPLEILERFILVPEILNHRRKICMIKMWSTKDTSKQMFGQVYFNWHFVLTFVWGNVLLLDPLDEDWCCLRRLSIGSRVPEPEALLLVGGLKADPCPLNSLRLELKE